MNKVFFSIGCWGGGDPLETCLLVLGVGKLYLFKTYILGQILPDIIRLIAPMFFFVL